MGDKKICSCGFWNLAQKECLYTGDCIITDLRRELEELKLRKSLLRPEGDNLIVMLNDDEWVEVINTMKSYCANTLHGSFDKLEKTINVLTMLTKRYQEAYDRKFKK